MKVRKLGRSGLLVSELCLGTMIFGEDSPRSTSPDVARQMIDRYLETGGNYIDTADVYAGGRSEEIVGEALKGRRGQAVLATKVRFATGDGPNDNGLTRGHILKGVEASLRRLQTDWIDLLYMHSWDPRTPIEESLRAFDDLVHAGKARYIGVSNFKAWQLMKALGVSQAQGWVRFVAAQYQYSLVVRDIELEFLDLCQTEGVGLVPWGPLGGGFLSGKYRPDQRPSAAAEGRLATTPNHDEEAWSRRDTQRNWDTLQAVKTVCDAHPGSTPAQIALAWLLSRPGVASVVLGARTPDQLEDNLQAANLTLNPDELDLLDRTSAIEPGYPYRYLQLYGTRD